MRPTVRKMEGDRVVAADGLAGELSGRLLLENRGLVMRKTLLVGTWVSESL